MYLKETKGKNKTYLTLVEGYREGKEVKHRKLLSLGAIDKLNRQNLYRLATKLLQYTDNPSIESLTEGHEESRRNYGVVKVVESLWEQFGLADFFKGLLAKRKIKYDLESTLKLLLASRLCQPCSKYKNYEMQGYYSGLPEISLQNIYKSLDELYGYRDKIEQHLYESQKKQFKMNSNVVFFDVTTFYFESNRADELREFGFSKDLKVNEVQVVLSLLVTEEGRPIGYDLFPGNMYEGNTLIEALKKLKTRYELKEVILVADRGICSFKNLSAISQAGYHYIVGTRIRNTTSKLQQDILVEKDYHTFIEDEEETIKYKILNTERKNKKEKLKERWICTWSSKRAKKDKMDRERIVERSREMVEHNQYKSQRGARKYIQTSIGHLKVNEAKIAVDAQWDGYYAIATNDENLPAKAIQKAYHQLWMIEESFRIMKSHLETRPMFHWTAKRIQGHILLSYIAFVFERTLELALKHSSAIQHTPNAIRDALSTMEFSTIVCQQKKIYVRAKLTETAENILQILKCDLPPQIQFA